MIRKRWTSKELDLNVDGAQVEFDLLEAISGTVQATAQDQTWGTAVLTLYRGNDLFGWAALEGGGVTIGPDDGMTAELDLAGFRYLAVRVTTVEGGAQKAIITLCYTVDSQ